MPETKEKYKFKILCLEKKLTDGFHCMFTEPSEGKAAIIYQALKKQIEQLEHIHFIGGLMDNIHIKGKEGAKEWSKHISPLVSFDKKVDNLSNQLFYFTIENNKILPSNKL